MPVLESMLAGAGSAAINTGLGLALQGHNNKVQLRQQQKLGEQQLGFDFRKMEEQRRQQMRMWEDTNFGAQMEQLKKAGLSPGLYYGGSGGGGMTTTGAGATSTNAPSARDQGDILGMQMIQAQRNLIEAQTEKTKAEATKISGVDTTETETRIESLTQGIENQKAQARLTTIQGNLAEIQQDLNTENYDDISAMIRTTARQAEKQLGILANEKEISDQVKDEKIALVEGELIGLGLANEMKREQIQLTTEQTKKVVADVAQGWKKLAIDQQNAITNFANSETAKKNANTNVREYLEKVRSNDYDYTTKQQALDLQKLINDVPESTKMTVGAISNIFKWIRISPARGR